jgi:hypothetical protein
LNGRIVLTTQSHHAHVDPLHSRKVTTCGGRTEFSASFDSLAYQQPTTHFGDRASFAATCVVHDGDKLDIAIAPQVSILLRGDAGARIGSTAIARYDSGHHSAGVTFTWTGATASSVNNPAGTSISARAMDTRS